MDPNLIRLVRLSNPWLESPERFAEIVRDRLPSEFIPRLVHNAKSWPVRKKAHLLIGARQVGKSSYLWHWFKKRGVAPFFLNGEEPLIQQWSRSPTLMLDDLRNLATPEMPVFVDEAQHLPEAGLFIKGLIDGGLMNELYVTGSSAFHLHAKTRESLAGRAIRTGMHPLSLQELALDEPSLPGPIAAERVKELAMRQMEIGSYPGVWTAPVPEDMLIQLVESFVLRDASDLFQVQSLEAFRKLLALLAGQVGNLVNTTEWAAICGVSRTAITNYIDILEQSRIITVATPFVGGKRAEITSRPKIYFCDCGVRNSVGGGFGNVETRGDKGPLFENWVAAELVKWLPPLDPSIRMHYWRSKSGAEVDFVISHGDMLYGVEAKASPLTRPKLSRSARSFIETYQPRRFIIVCWQGSHTDTLGNTEIVWTDPTALTRPELFGLEPN